MNRIRGDLSTFGGLVTIPAPRVQVLCYIPRLDLGFQVDFMIDTGACGTCLNGGYALGLQHSMRQNSLYYSTGIGGQCGYYREDAVLVFTDTRGHQLARQLELGIQQIQESPDPQILRTPCLLGRDIISEWKFRYDHRDRHVELIVP
jgi:hypothetical protein